MTETRYPTQYPQPLVLLHWLMAILIVGMLASGLLSGEEDLLSPMQQFQLVQWHKAFGVAALLLIVLRVGVRLWAVAKGKIPAVPAGLKPWEIKAAHLGHLGLYAAMVLLPLTGWLMVSSSPYGLPTLLWGSVAWPHIPFVAGLTWVNEVAYESHELLANGLIVLLAVHVAAVIKHWYADGMNLLKRLALCTLAVLPFTFADAHAAPYQLNAAESRVSFRGLHVGREFTGSFKQWSGQVEWDAANLAASKISVSFVAASVSTTDPTYDATLPTADWFDSANHPNITFESTEVTAGISPFAYTAKGMLTMRGVSQPVAFNFTLTPLPNRTDGAMRAVGALNLDRLAFGVGAKSDPTAKWVNRTIAIRIDAVGVPVRP